MYLFCQFIVLFLLVVISALIIKCYLEKSSENGNENWKSILKDKLGILGIVFLFTFIFFLMSNIVVTFLEKNQFAPESVLGYKDVVNLFPVYLTLAVTIIIAVIQFFIQEDLRKKAENEASIQIAAHMNEQLAESLKRYFYFDRYGKIKYFGNGKVEIVIRMLNEAMGCYFTINTTEITLGYDSEEVQIAVSSDNSSNAKISTNELDLHIRLNNEALHSMVTTMIEDALTGKKKTGKIEIEAIITDNSLNNFGDNPNAKRNTNIALKIIAGFHPNGQIFSDEGDEGICISVYDMSVCGNKEVLVETQLSA